MKEAFNTDGIPDITDYSVFSNYLELYEPVYPQMESSGLVRFQVEDDVLNDGVVSDIELTEEQLAYDISMCRYFEGVEYHGF